MLNKLVCPALFWRADNLKCVELYVTDLFPIWSSSTGLPSYGQLKNSQFSLQDTAACLISVLLFNLLTHFDMEELESNGRISQMK